MHLFFLFIICMTVLTELIKQDAVGSQNMSEVYLIGLIFIK